MLSDQKYGKNLHVNYSPFGAILYGRNWSSEKYRYGFNGQEKMDEIYGENNFVDFAYRGYSTRLARFFVIDPLSNEFTWQSTYQVAFNNPLGYIELEGLQGSSPGLRSYRPRANNYQQSRQHYANGVARARADFQTQKTRGLDPQFSFMPQAPPPIPRVIVLTDPQNPTTSPQQTPNNPKTSTAFYTAKSIEALEEIRKNNSLGNVNKVEEFNYGSDGIHGIRVSTSYQIGGIYVNQFEKIKQLQAEYNKEFDKEVSRFMGGDEEEGAPPVWNENRYKLATGSARIKLGPSPLEVIQAELKKAFDGADSSTEHTKTTINPSAYPGK